MIQTHSPRPLHALHFILRVTLLGALTLTAACTPKFIKGTTIDYSPDKQEVSAFIERYRQALESLDFDTIKDMASQNYYENGSTTDDPSDDYDFNGLMKILMGMKRTVKAVKYSITIKNIEVAKTGAAVDYEYSGQFLFSSNNQDRWSTKSDKNRITLTKNKLGEWKIVSGL
jgi:hypothetical protein